MFGKDFILGNSEATMDSKGRIDLPLYSIASAQDIVSIIKNDNFLEVYDLLTIKSKIINLMERIKNYPDQEALFELEEIYTNYMETCIVDDKLRIIIPKDYRQSLSSKKVRLQGAVSCLRIMPMNCDDVLNRKLIINPTKKD